MKSASPETRRAFEAAVRDSGITVKGYPRDPSKAPPQMLRNDVRELAATSEDIASAVLRSWAESHVTLRKQAARHLEEEGIPLAAADASKERFGAAWDFAAFLETRDGFVETYASEEFDVGEAGLMLCYLSGKMPELDVRTDLERGFEVFLKYLESLPPTAFWDHDISEFAGYVQEIAQSKEADLERIYSLNDTIREFEEAHGDLLAFFEWDTEHWSSEHVASAWDLTEARDSIVELNELLGRFERVRPVAPTMREEQKRSEQRKELSARVLEALKSLDGLISGDGELAASPRFELRLVPCELTEDGGEERVDTGSDEPATAPSISSADGADGHGSDVRTEEVYAIHSTTVAGPVGPTARDYEALQTENRSLRELLNELRRELRDSRLLAESWRTALREPVAEAEKSPLIESLEDVVNLATERFRGKLKIWPNSKSEIENNPFDSPRQAWDALEWLATTYRDSRMGESGVSDFNSSIRQVCGWWYKSHQNESTVSKYREWYSATVDGRTYLLHEHIGTGVSRDSRYTIRIGFDWDKLRNRVVVGYVGQHPKTDAT